jgi:hypothetical protein
MKCVLCSDGGVEWQGLIASEVEQKAPMRVLPCLAMKYSLWPASHTIPSHIHLSTPRRRPLSPKFPVRSGNFGVVAEFSIICSFAEKRRVF